MPLVLLSLQKQLNSSNACSIASLYRPDIESLLFVSGKASSEFFAKNVISEDLCATNELLVRCLEVGDTSLVLRDVSGVCRFGADLVDKEALLNALDACRNPILKNLVVQYRADALALYEEVFGHRIHTPVVQVRCMRLRALVRSTGIWLPSFSLVFSRQWAG